MTDLNKKILDEIDKSEYSENIKNFLRTVLIFEYKHMNDPKPIYSKDYERAISDNLSQLEDE